ncbi:MAG: PEP/pyruvate-binding domain-containing protein [Solirubrobacterales bacterium]|nr:PEP/pyruvate-binding domain-containing protein [Solirubrobacterales bacterium]
MAGSAAGVRYTRPLNELGRGDAPAFGGKSATLGELLAAEIPVPSGFAVSTAAFAAFLEQSQLAGRLEDALTGLAPGELAAIEAASRSVGEALRAAPVPDAVAHELARRYAELADTAGIECPPVAVRSSALGEDSQDATYAGQQETYLWVTGAQQVCDAVRDCWVSLYSPTAISYRLRLGAGSAAAEPEPAEPEPAEPEPAKPEAMGVTVQLMVDAAVSGVLFTCNPVSGDPSMVAINASWGLGLAVVGGEVTPDDYLVSKVTGEVVRERLHAKQVEYVPDRSGRGAVRIEVAPERRELACVDHEALAALLDTARRVERHFGCPQDVEWAIAREQALPESLFVVQSRAVTGLGKKSQSKPKSAISMVMGTFGVKDAAD